MKVSLQGFSGSWSILFMLASVVLLLLDIPAALAPEWNYDSLVYHLAVPAEFLKVGKLYLYQGHCQYHFPLAVEMLYLPAYSLGGESAAKLLNLVVWILVAHAVANLARIAGGSRGAGILAAALLLATPIVGFETESAFNECGWCLWTALALQYAVAARPRLSLALVFMGLAASGKYIALIQDLPFVALLLYRGVLPRRKWPLAAGLLLTPVAPWLIKNWLFVLDPLYPALARFGCSFGLPVEAFERILRDANVIGLRFSDHPLYWIGMPWDFVQHDLSGRYSHETIGPGLLCLAPILAAWVIVDTGAVSRRLLYVSSSWGAVWALTDQWNRLLLPAILPMCALASVVVEHAASSRRLFLRCACLMTLGWGILWRMDHRLATDDLYESIGAVTGKVPIAVWRARHLPLGPALRELDAVVHAPGKALVLFQEIAYGSSSRCVQEAVNSWPVLARLAERSSNPEELRRRLLSEGITTLAICGEGMRKHVEGGQFNGLSVRTTRVLWSFLDIFTTGHRIGPALIISLKVPAASADRGRAPSNER